MRLHNHNTGEAAEMSGIQGKQMGNSVCLHRGHNSSIIDLASDNVVSLYKSVPDEKEGSCVRGGGRAGSLGLR
jgi:hypothetical protein